MENEDVYMGSIPGSNNNLYSIYLNVSGQINTFTENSNPCSEIELPKEKKSEKPNFNQTKK